MTASRIECPECETVLKPARPLAPGKAVKCPKCGTTFKVPGEAPVERAQSKAKAEAAAAPGRKKAAAKKDDKKPEKKPPAKAAGDDEDDEGHTYGVTKEADEEEAEEKKPKINYAPDTSIRDLRGPAQAKVMKPTNLLTLWGAIGFIGWTALLILILIPAVFPLDTDQGKKDQPVEALEFGLGLGRPVSSGGMMGMVVPPPPSDSSDKEKKEDKDDRPMLLLFGTNLALFGLFSVIMFLIVIVLPIIVGMCYSALICHGSVQAQSLESRGWGIAGSILAMCPVNMLGLLIVASTFINFMLGMMLDEQEIIDWICIGLIIVFTLAGIGVGVYALKTLLDKDVIAGFEYKAE